MNIYKLYWIFLDHFRPRRMHAFADLFKINSSTRILDIGGYPYNWGFISKPLDITLLNLSYHPSHIEKDRFCYVVGNALHLPFKDNGFDIIFSNSVIEHLSDYENQQKFANEVVRVGICYYIQTPYRYFFIEPHLLTPFIHFLPRKWMLYFLKYFTIWGLITRPSNQECKEKLNEIHLLDYRSMKQLFPEAQIHRERFLGLTKSLIASYRKGN